MELVFKLSPEDICQAISEYIGHQNPNTIGKQAQVEIRSNKGGIVGATVTVSGVGNPGSSLHQRT